MEDVNGHLEDVLIGVPLVNEDFISYFSLR